MDTVIGDAPGAKETPVFYTDSAVVLAWLRTPFHQLKVFEANRVSAILSRSSSEQWHHVRSEDNPADIASRGRFPSQLVGEQLWWNGPSWLYDRHWSVPPPIPTLLANETAASIPDTSWMTRFSSLQRLIGTTAWILRWVRCLRQPTASCTGPLTGEERTGALLRCARQVQQTIFPSALSKHPLSLDYRALQPFIDEDGIVRVGGRLERSSVPHAHKHPVLLTRRHHLSRLIISDIHDRHFHAGPTLTVSLLRCRFWIPGAYRTAKGIIRECVRCRQINAAPFTPPMGDLPSERVQVCRAFEKVGVDFAGPFLVKESGRRKAATRKTYACVFVCLASKAIHIELVSSLSTDDFIEALDRFTARRGLPTVLQSDHGTNFVGASRFLKAVHSAVYAHKQRLLDHLATKGIEWKFIPPRSPHFGGLWEAAIKAAKHLLPQIIGTQPYTFEELNTVLIKIEGLLNSRPLCPLREDPQDWDTLTPGHLLIGAPLHSLPKKEDEVLDPRSRWKGVQQRTRAMWERWRKEYLHHLQQRTRWTKKDVSPAVGELVIMIERRTPIGVWPVARVSDVHPGTDGVVRVVTVRTPSGQCHKRSVRTLAPLFATL